MVTIGYWRGVVTRCARHQSRSGNREGAIQFQRAVRTTASVKKWRCPTTLRKCFSVSSQAEATERSTHVCIAPARNVVGPLPHAAPRAFDDVGRSQTVEQRRRQLEPDAAATVIDGVPLARR